MSILTRILDDCYPNGDYWYEGELEYFVEDLRTRGIEIEREKQGKSLVPAISFSGFYSQGDGLAFDASINWKLFLETHPDFKEQFPEWFLLLVANPDYFNMEVRRSGRNSNCLVVNLEDDFPDIVERGFFAGMDMVDEVPGLNSVALETYVLKVCQEEAHQLYKSLEQTYEAECEYIKEQQIEEIIDENKFQLQRVLLALMLHGETFDTHRVHVMDAEEGVEMEDLERLGLIQHVTRSIYRVSDRGKDLICGRLYADL